MTKTCSAIAAAAVVALSPTCSTALSLMPRPRPQSSIRPAAGDGLFGKRSSGSGGGWMVPSFRSSKFLLSRIQSTKDKEVEPFFVADEDSDEEDGDEKSWPVKPTPPPEPSAEQITFVAPPKPVIPETRLTVDPSIVEKLDPLLNPTIAKAVPAETIRGAGIGGVLLTLLTSFLFFGPFSVSSLGTLIAAASVGIISAYISITEGAAGDFARSAGQATIGITDWALENAEDWQVEKEVNKIANALLTPPPKAESPASPKKAAAGDSLPLVEGLTAEEAEAVRIARLVGGTAEATEEGADGTRVTEGQTAEEAEASRNARLEAADKAAAAEQRRLEEEIEEMALRTRMRAEEEARAAEEARLQAAEEARWKAEEEAIAQARAKAAEEEARLKAEEEASRVRAEEKARLRAEEEAREVAEAEEARRLADQAAAAREAVRLMEEQEALMDDEEDDEEDELDDEDWEASVRLANELQGIVSSDPIGGDVIDAIADEMLQSEIDDLTAEEEGALGRAAREAVRKYEEEMAMKSSGKKARSAPPSWEEEMVVEAPPPPIAEDAADPINGIEEAEEVAADVDYSKMTVVQLKEVLRSKGLKVSGKKAVLIERLMESS